MRAVPILLALLAICLGSGREDWKPASSPLMTRWGKQIRPENAWQSYPRPQLVRADWQCLNGLWQYAITPRGAAVPNPWTGSILVPFAIESALSGVGQTVSDQQWLWYRREFPWEQAWQDRRLVLHFDAVDWESEVFINGRSMGIHRGGSNPFAYDITPFVKKESPNELVVRVWDPTDLGPQPRGKQVRKPEGIWYTPVTGIWQSVWLEPVHETHLQSFRPVCDIDAGTVLLHPKIVQAQAGDQIRIELFDGDQRLLHKEFNADAPVALTLTQPKLWSPSQPFLYRFKATLLRQGRPLDETRSYFAMRQISVGKDAAGHLRLLLNHQPLFQYGPLDQGWWPDGLLTPPSEEALLYDLQVLKKMGMNMLRKHIKVEPSLLYYHCDRLGLLVWQDMPSAMQAGRSHFVGPRAERDAVFTQEEKKQFRYELEAMIDHLAFFSCIVVWVPFNEGWGQHDTNDVLRWVKQKDPTRLVNGPSGWTDRGFGDMKDMHSYPGPGMFPSMPDRVSVLGEFGGLGLPMKGHLWKESNNWGYRTYKNDVELRDNYHLLIKKLRPLIAKGLAAAVYTQTTDVEIEVNGLMTYDREVIKIDPEEVARWHATLWQPMPEVKDVLATSEVHPQTWSITFDRPADDWFKPDFDDASWSKGPGGFGTRGTPGGNIRTTWRTNDIWLRRSFELKELPQGELFLLMHHDEDVEVYINGVMAVQTQGYLTSYERFPMAKAARETLRQGINTMAIHCRQTSGGQYIDAGLEEWIERNK